VRRLHRRRLKLRDEQVSVLLRLLAALRAIADEILAVLKEPDLR